MIIGTRLRSRGTRAVRPSARAGILACGSGPSLPRDHDGRWCVRGAAELRGAQRRTPAQRLAMRGLGLGCLRLLLRDDLGHRSVVGEDPA
jgi:hypothetical protein